MTEEDTFNALKRRPLVDLFDEFQRGLHGMGPLAVYRLMINNHWAMRDFYNIYFDTLLTDYDYLDKETWIRNHMSNSATELKNKYDIDV